MDKHNPRETEQSAEVEPSPALLAAEKLCEEHPAYVEGCSKCETRRAVWRAELVEQAEDWIRDS